MVEFHAQPGDLVKLRLAQEEKEGTVLMSPDSSLILLKLPSGYNIGIPKENILACKTMKKYAPLETSRILSERDLILDSAQEPGFRVLDKTAPAAVQKEGKPAIGLIVTGGTIASKLDPKTGGAKPLTSASEFAHSYPELFTQSYVKRLEIPFLIASESMDSTYWIRIATVVKGMLDDPEIKGVVVTHGTDTLHYTAAALSFFLRGLTKPVVLTYSQRSIDRASSDAHLNLQCAATMALSEAAEVMLVGHGSVNDDFCFALRGTKVRKMHSSRRDAFQPVNSEPIAKVWADKIEFLGSYTKRREGKTELDTEFTDKIALVKFYPGQDASILDFYALKYKGVVIESLGLGHVGTSESHHSWIPALKKHIRQGLIVCAAAQTTYGRLDPYVYSNGRELIDAGVIFLEDMLAETAFVKLGFVLGHFGWKGKVKEKMLENMSGELNPRLCL